jgi:peptide/nickel transport system permease protein
VASADHPDPQSAVDDAYAAGLGQHGHLDRPAEYVANPMFGVGPGDLRTIPEGDFDPLQDLEPGAALVAVGGDTAIAVPSGGEATGSGRLGMLMLRVFLENKLAVAGFAIVIFFILFSFLGPLFYHTPQGLGANGPVFSTSTYLAPPSSAHWLGTDANGYDELGRMMVGGQSALEIAIAAAGMATLFGVFYGAISGFAGGAVDSILMRIVDILLSIPSLFLLVVLAAVLGSSVLLLMLIVGIVAWLVPARLVRGETLTLRTREYVQAVRGMGGTRGRIVFRHIIPNAIGTIVVNATFQVADALLIVAALGYLGFGPSPPATSWGQILADGVQFVTSSPVRWWVFYPAGIAIVLTVVGFNFIGDALRDSLETRLQKR